MAIEGKDALALHAQRSERNAQRRVETRRERFEYMYHVDNPSLMSLAELAALTRELGSW
ncbi:MAG TPA: hypothetical protein VFK02_10160 [Kofleriaceae bacterium]|nr:hypothetical protein [Kofleriaceae bacterium]